MIVELALSLALAQTSPPKGFVLDPTPDDFPGELLGWHWDWSDGDVWDIDIKDVKRDGRFVTYWLRGEHSKNPKVRYRRSAWYYSLDCAGRSTLLAYSTYAADGSVLSNWDGRDSSVLRPGTLGSTIEKAVCKQ